MCVRVCAAEQSCSVSGEEAELCEYLAQNDVQTADYFSFSMCTDIDRFDSFAVCARKKCIFCTGHSFQLSTWLVPSLD